MEVRCTCYQSAETHSVYDQLQTDGKPSQRFCRFQTAFGPHLLNSFGPVVALQHCWISVKHMDKMCKATLIYW